MQLQAVESSQSGLRFWERQPQNFVITMSKKHYHVTPRNDGWAVQGTGSERASSLHRTQAEAIDAGRRLAQQAQSELRIHRPDGRIREGWSYGNDPHPPKG